MVCMLTISKIITICSSSAPNVHDPSAKALSAKPLHLRVCSARLPTGHSTAAHMVWTLDICFPPRWASTFYSPAGPVGHGANYIVEGSRRRAEGPSGWGGVSEGVANSHYADLAGSGLSPALGLKNLGSSFTMAPVGQTRGRGPLVKEAWSGPALFLSPPCLCLVPNRYSTP